MGTGLQRSDLLSWHEQVSIKLLDWLEYIGEDKYMFSGSSTISYYTTKAPYTRCPRPSNIAHCCSLHTFKEPNAIQSGELHVKET